MWQSVIAKGLEADPLSIPLHSAASNYPTYAQTPKEAMSHARRIVEIAPDSPLGLKRLAQYSWSLEGRADEAIRWALDAFTARASHNRAPQRRAWFQSIQYLLPSPKENLAPNGPGARSNWSRGVRRATYVGEGRNRM